MAMPLYVLKTDKQSPKSSSHSFFNYAFCHSALLYSVTASGPPHDFQVDITLWLLAVRTHLFPDGFISCSKRGIELECSLAWQSSWACFKPWPSLLLSVMALTELGYLTSSASMPMRWSVMLPSVDQHLAQSDRWWFQFLYLSPLAISPYCTFEPNKAMPLIQYSCHLSKLLQFCTCKLSILLMWTESQ